MERDRRGVCVGLRTRLPCGKEAEESATSLCYCTRASKPLGLLTYYCSVIIIFQRFFSFPHHFRSQKIKNQKQFPWRSETMIFFLRCKSFYMGIAEHVRVFQGDAHVCVCACARAPLRPTSVTWTIAAT